MARGAPVEGGGRIARLLRRLGEGAEREAGSRSRPSATLERVLSVQPGDPGSVLEALLGSSADLDAGCVVTRTGDGWSVTAAVGLDGQPLGRRLAREAVEEGILSAATRGDVVVASLHGEAPLPIPATTRALCAVPVLDAAGVALALLLVGSRSAHRLGEEDVLAARVAGLRLLAHVHAASVGEELARSDESGRQATAFRDHVLAIVGHDLRNPLGAIVMSAALLQKKGGLAGWQGKTVDRIRGSAARMGRIIDDLLSYTRTRLGNGIPVHRGRADLHEIARRTIDELKVAHPGATIEVSASGDLGGEWDAARLEQVISNVVSNAVDHGTDDEPVRVTLRGDGDAVEIAVENRGEMPHEVLEHAFEAFCRGPEHTGKKASGLGLGLFIAREIVRRHGGEVWARSDCGSTRIVMRVPRRDVTPPVGSPPQAAGEVP